MRRFSKNLVKFRNEWQAKVVHKFDESDQSISRLLYFKLSCDNRLKAEMVSTGFVLAELITSICIFIPLD